MQRNWKLINFCEFDKYAVKSYCAIHGIDVKLNLGDITKVDEKALEPFTMICGSSPCQDLSIAGKKKGAVWHCKDCENEYNPLTVHWKNRGKCPKCNSENLDKSRSSLLVDFLRVIEAKRPNFGVYENVKNLVGKQFRNTTFKLFEDELSEYGYNVYWQVMNSKDYGVPQNRERLILLFIKKELDNGKFVFPKGFDNGIRLKDIMEDDVDAKFYISEERLKQFVPQESKKDSVVKQVGSVVHTGNFKNPQRGRIYSKEGCSPSLNTCGGGGLEPKILLEDNSIRKLTQKEMFRLMGFSDADYEAANKVVSPSQLSKQTGNSVVVDVLYYVFVELYKAMPYLFDDLTVSSFFSGIGSYEKALDKLYDSINTGNFQNPQV
jgi:DNA (cytosine-5)-methyltransferase 1